MWQRNIWILFFDVAGMRQTEQQVTHIHQPSAWPVPNACAQSYHPGSGSHDSFFTLIKAHRHGMAVGPMNQQSRVFCCCCCCCCCCFELGVHKGVQCCAAYQHTKHRHKTTTLYFVNCTLHLASGWVHEHAKYRRGNEPRPPPLTKLHNFTNIYST